jgi:pectinesterase
MIEREAFTILLTAACGLATAKDVTVAQEGSGDFKTVQSAIDAIPSNPTERTVIRIKPGTYKERIRVPKDKPMITFQGDDGAVEKTILTWDYSAKSKENDKEVGTSGSYSTLVESNDFMAQHITFENTAGEVGQAVALRTTGDRQVFRNCRFLGWQDTLYTHQGRCYFVDCYIEGRVDFIFGRSTALFENCHIHSKNGGYVTAAATPKEAPFGYVFIKCKLTGTGGPASTYLGRPWRPDASVAYIECEMGDHIKPEGWHNWGKESNEQTARYVEYLSTGPGANAEKRVAWSKQLTADEAKQYIAANVLSGADGWDPKKQ